MSVRGLVDRSRVDERAKQRVVHDAEAEARVVPVVGAHVSSAGGVSRAVERAVAMGAEALQVWVDQPRRFPRKPLPGDELARLREGLAATGLTGYVHVPYLVNLATADRSLRRGSIDMVCRALQACRLGGLDGAVVHVGSHLGRGFARVRRRVVAGLAEACARADDPGRLLVENAAGGGGRVGANVDELREILDLLADAGIRARLCVDLQHAHAAGADLSNESGVLGYAGELRAEGLASRIGLVHANDSASASGSRRDLHANPGEGTIGARGLRACARVPELARVPWLLEVPGPERKGPTRREIRRLRRIVAG